MAAALARSVRVLMSAHLEAAKQALDPQLYLDQVDLDQSTLGFSTIDMDAFRQAPFLDERLQAVPGSGRRYLPIASAASLMDSLRPSARKIGYIFHSAFCCSTLVSKCLDVQGNCISLREPLVLMQLANYKRTKHPVTLDREAFISLIDLVVFYLSHAGNCDERVLIKPTNAANNLAAEIIESRATGGVILLHSSLEYFLVSVIKKGEDCRAFVRRLFNIVRGDSAHYANLPGEALLRMTDLQIAALTWNLQVERYLELLKRYPRAAIRTLDCETLLREPVAVIAKLFQHFGCEVDDAVMEAIATGPVFNRDSKDRERIYDAAQRAAEFTQVRRTYSREIDQVLAWDERLRPGGAIRLPLPQALM